MAKYANYKDVLESVSCEDAANMLGLKMVKKGGNTYVQCPFHEKILGKRDAHIGNCSIYDHGKRCHCWSCGGNGNAIEMVMAYLDLPFKQAVDQLAEGVAPHLIRDQGTDRDKQPRKIYPFTEQELELLGFCFENVQRPVNAAGSAFSVRPGNWRSSFYDWDAEAIGWNTLQYEGDHVVLYKTDRMTPSDLFEIPAWKEIVRNKGTERIGRCKEALSSLKTIPKTWLRIGIEKEIEQMIGDIEKILTKIPA